MQWYQVMLTVKALSPEKTALFPGETFRILKEKEEKQYVEYRTRRLVLEGADRLEGT